tara:strand:+ start:1798 stop:1953 length:156 start_codon:yes stop_codon:yes gene_type:complete
MKKSSMIKFNKKVDELDKAAAKHLVKLGVEKDWRDCYRRMRLRRKRRAKYE